MANSNTASNHWNQAIRQLCRNDSRLRKLIARVGPCTLQPRKDYFVVLCKAIFSQQLSTKVAATLFGRFCDLFPRRRPTPGLVLNALKGDPQVLRRCGLSRQKHKYIADLAHHFHDKIIPTHKLAAMSDEEIIEALTAVHGIGRWTAEMFLIFTLNRPDVLPVDDLGLRKGIQSALAMKEMPTPKQCVAIGEAWRPWRSVATWYLWKSLAMKDDKSTTRQNEKAAG